MLSAKQTCKRRPSESPEVFVNRYKTYIARYVNQSSVTNRGDDKHWVLIILRNAMLIPVTLIFITFQLTAGAETSTERPSPVIIDASVPKKVMTTIISMANDPETDPTEEEKDTLVS